jgi:hypothetical protein
MNFNRTLVLTALSIVTFPALAAKTYQATGPIVAMTDSSITVQKGNEKWEIERTPSTKIIGELKVGSKVTIEYTMNATTVTAKPEKSAKK